MVGLLTLSLEMDRCDWSGTVKGVDYETVTTPRPPPNDRDLSDEGVPKIKGLCRPLSGSSREKFTFGLGWGWWRKYLRVRDPV